MISWRREVLLLLEQPSPTRRQIRGGVAARPAPDERAGPRSWPNRWRGEHRVRCRHARRWPLGYSDGVRGSPARSGWDLRPGFARIRGAGRRSVGSPLGYLLEAGRESGRQEPCSGASANSSSPPISSTRRREMASPSPEPPCSLAELASPCAKSSKISSRCEGEMPIPVSRISNSTKSPSAASRGTPDDDHDFAFLRELHGVADQVEKDLAQPMGITLDVLWHVGLDPVRHLESFAVGLFGHQLHRFLDQRPQAELDARQTARPDSILEKSRISLISCRRLFAEA